MTKYYLIVDKTNSELKAVTSDKTVANEIISQRKGIMKLKVVEQNSKDVPSEIATMLKKQDTTSLYDLDGVHLFGMDEENLVHEKLGDEIKNIYETSDEVLSVLNYIHFTEEEYDIIEHLYLLLNQIIAEFEEAQYDEERYWGETIDTPQLLLSIIKKHYIPEDRKGL